MIRDLLGQFAEEITQCPPESRFSEFRRLKDLVSDCEVHLVGEESVVAACFDSPTDNEQPLYLWVVTNDRLLSLRVASMETEQGSWTLAVNAYPLSSLVSLQVEISRYEPVYRRVEMCLATGNVAITPHYGTTPEAHAQKFVTTLYRAVS